MSEYFVVMSNISSIPSIIYYKWRDENFLSMQIFLTSIFSLIHHLDQSRLYIIDGSSYFGLMDAAYAYWLIYLFIMYLLLENHNELVITRSCMFTLMIGFQYFNLGIYCILPTIGIISSYILYINKEYLNPIIFHNKYFYSILTLSSIDIICYVVAYKNIIYYNYYHSIHHLIAFNIPIIVNKYKISNSILPILELEQTLQQ